MQIRRGEKAAFISWFKVDFFQTFELKQTHQAITERMTIAASLFPTTTTTACPPVVAALSSQTSF